MVEAGQCLGAIHFIDDPLRTRLPVTIRQRGLLLMLRHPGRTERGDCVAQVATDIDPSTIGRQQRSAAGERQ